MVAGTGPSIGGAVVVFAGISGALLGGALARKRGFTTTPPKARVDGKYVPFGNVPGEKRGDDPMTPTKVIYDPYFWLRDDDRKNPAVLEHLHAENRYCASKTGHLKPVAEDLYKEILSHIKETDEGVPYPYGDYMYYHKTIKGLSYRVYCRKKTGSDKEEILLDMNQVSKGKSYCDLGTLSMSPDHRVMGYTLDETGGETYKAFFKDVSSGKMLEEDMPPNTGSLVWGQDNKTIFYAVHDEAHRPYKLFRHKMGTSASNDQLLFTEDNDEYWMGFGKSLSGRYLLVSSGTSESSEVMFLDLDAHGNDDVVDLVMVHPREKKLLYDIDHYGDYFYIVTNADGAKNQKLMRTKIANPSKKHWEDVVAYDEQYTISDVTCFKRHIVVEGRHGGFTVVWYLKPESGKLQQITGFPDTVSSVGVGTNKIFDTDTVRVVYESMVTPLTTYDINLKTLDKKKIHQKDVPNYDPSLYECKRLVAVGHDGVEIPMSIVYRKDIARKPGPLYLHGYGSYGICCDPGFSASLVPLLDRGVTYVDAHIRGGGEMGRTWYEDHGKYLTKKNTFEDFVSCAKYLIKENYTTPEMFGITGRSAGGLLMGATLNMAPQLFKCCVAGVPFVDVLNTMSDPSIPLTCGEWTEWGNPNNAKYHDYIASYCPYTNVTRQDYPNMLVLAGLNDPRVAYWEPAKWVARLRELKTDDNEILLKTDMDSGHFSASDRYFYLREKSFEYAFVLDQIVRKTK